MQSLRERLEETGRFLVGVELVSVRGSMAEERAVRARDFAGQLVDSPSVDWVSITDNAGGNPQLAPMALAKPMLYAGREVVIHLTCKDLNRNGLESQAWQLNSEGFHNILAMTGDYPVGGDSGTAKPVFDLDSVGLISLLGRMNRGLNERHKRTEFCVGAVVNNYKVKEGEVVPQYLKLEKKVECGASFIINQVGYDSRKAHELKVYMRAKGLDEVPLIGNVFVLSPRTARMFNAGKIPGVVVTESLLELCEREGRSADGGRAFFDLLAAKQMAIYRGMGFRGVYLGGIHSVATVERVIELERSFSAHDWKIFVRELRYSRPGEFYLYGVDKATGLSSEVEFPTVSRPAPLFLGYQISKAVHRRMFTHGSWVARFGANACRHSQNPAQGPPLMRGVEKFGKSLLFECRDCGDCSLPEVAYLCPESQCAKNQRNGPCGGTRDGACEVAEYGECVWVRAYERLKGDGKERKMLSHAPVVQDQNLRGTSSWANTWLGRDHVGKR